MAHTSDSVNYLLLRLQACLNTIESSRRLQHDVEQSRQSLALGEDQIKIIICSKENIPCRLILIYATIVRLAILRVGTVNFGGEAHRWEMRHSRFKLTQQHRTS